MTMIDVGINWLAVPCLEMGRPGKKPEKLGDNKVFFCVCPPPPQFFQVFPRPSHLYPCLNTKILTGEKDHWEAEQVNWNMSHVERRMRHSNRALLMRPLQIFFCQDNNQNGSWLCRTSKCMFWIWSKNTFCKSFLHFIKPYWELPRSLH